MANDSSPQQATREWTTPEVLASCLKVLVLVRESLKAIQAQDSDLFRAVDAHCTLAMSKLPPELILDPEEFKRIQRGARGMEMNQVLDAELQASGPAKLPKAGEMMVLDPKQIPGLVDKITSR